MQIECPYEDCQNKIKISADSEQGDLIVCRSSEGNGCNRNTEISNILREGEKISSVSLDTLEIDEDWGQ